MPLGDFTKLTFLNGSGPPYRNAAYHNRLEDKMYEIDQFGIFAQRQQSGRDFTNGTLIQTNLTLAINGNALPFFVEIEGNTYSRTYPIFCRVQGYFYQNTVISYGGILIGSDISGRLATNQITVFRSAGGFLCVWFPYQSYWEGYTIRVTNVSDSGVGSEKNTITSITNASFPADATIVTDIPLEKVWGSFNDGNGGQPPAPKPSGVPAGGTNGVGQYISTVISAGNPVYLSGEVNRPGTWDASVITLSASGDASMAFTGYAISAGLWFTVPTGFYSIYRGVRII